MFLDIAVESGYYEVSKKRAASIFKVTQLIQVDASTWTSKNLDDHHLSNTSHEDVTECLQHGVSHVVQRVATPGGAQEDAASVYHCTLWTYAG